MSGARVVPSPRLAAGLAVSILVHLLALWLLAARGPGTPQWPVGSGVGLALIEGVAPGASPGGSSAPPPVPVDGAAAGEPVAAAPQASALAGRGEASTRGGGRGGYLARLRAHLEAHKAPVPGGAGGTVLLRFEVGADGRVRDASVARSAGDAALDQEALALLLRAEPLPAPPQGAALRLLVPVLFE